MGMSPDGSLQTGCACDVSGTRSHQAAALAPLLFLFVSAYAGLRARRRRTVQICATWRCGQTETAGFVRQIAA